MRTYRYFAVLFLGLLLSALSGHAQSFEEYRRKAQADFQAYKEKTHSEFRAYREKVNAELEEYIRRAWVQIGREAPIEETIKDDEIKPTVIEEKKRDREIVPYVIYVEPEPKPAPQPVAPIEEVPQPSEKKFQFISYGTLFSVRFDADGKPRMKDASENSVADMWNALCEESCDNLYFDCLAIRDNKQLCDWAYVKLVENLAKAMYGADNTREAIVLQAVILTQSGYKVIMGRDDDSALHLLLASESAILFTPFYKVNDDDFYLFDGSTHEHMRFVSGTLPDFRNVRFDFTSEVMFDRKTSSPRSIQSKHYPAASATVTTNENLIRFYNDYPIPQVKGDPYSRWRYYAKAPLSKTARDSLYPKLRAAISGKNELQAANILLNFVQTGFVYKYDEDIWGYDRTFFPDESLYYPYCDCEDRAVLFSRLVRDLLGLKAVLVFYPGHLAAAVRFNSDVDGDFLMVKGQKYIICEATCLDGADVGYTGSGLDNGKAIVVEI
ncbi:MAG: hypothetical protein K6A62_03900 [Bacteroidales bacterium]|nr:hypothetical protein [Bacteroidales bacterium]